VGRSRDWCPVVSLGIFPVVPPTEPCALRSTQPLKVSTRSFSWGKGVRCVWLTNYHPCSAEMSRKSRALTYPEPLGHLSLLQETFSLLYTYIFPLQRDRKERKHYTDDWALGDEEIEGRRSFRLEDKMESDRFPQCFVKEMAGSGMLMLGSLFVIDVIFIPHDSTVSEVFILWVSSNLFVSVYGLRFLTYCSFATTVSQLKISYFSGETFKGLTCCTFLWVRWRHNCSPAASFANCVVTLYLSKVHLQTFLSVPITKNCQVLSCDTFVTNELYGMKLIPVDSSISISFT